MKQSFPRWFLRLRGRQAAQEEPSRWRPWLEQAHRYVYQRFESDLLKKKVVKNNEN